MKPRRIEKAFELEFCVGFLVPFRGVKACCDDGMPSVLLRVEGGLVLLPWG